MNELVFGGTLEERPTIERGAQETGLSRPPVLRCLDSFRAVTLVIEPKSFRCRSLIQALVCVCVVPPSCQFGTHRTYFGPQIVP